METEKNRLALQRADSLVGLPVLMDEFGVSIETVLDGTGVTPDALKPQVFIPYAAYLAILDRACVLTGRDDIGMRMGQRVTLAALGPLAGVMRHSATLGEALAEFAALQIRNSTGGAVYLMRTDQDIIFGYGVYDASARVSPQIYDLILAVGCNLIAELTGGAVIPDEILSSRAAPGDPAPYQRLARCPVRFGQNQTGLVLGASSLAFPLPAASVDLLNEALARLPSLPDGSHPPDMSARVRHLLRPLMLTGQTGMPDMSARLGLHPRTLRRHLEREGSTFEAIRDEVRYAAARELLMLGALSLADIALTLDYASDSAFVHAFRRWTGVSPGQWRKSRQPYPRSSAET